jgi:hypothetical protein
VSTTATKLKKQAIPSTTVSIYCDMSIGKPRLYVPAPLQLKVFKSIYNLLHQGNSEAGHKTFHVARHTEKFPHLGMGLTALPALQSLTPHTCPIGRLYAATNPFSSCPGGPSWGLFPRQKVTHTPHCSRSFHAPAGSHPHSG